MKKVFCIIIIAVCVQFLWIENAAAGIPDSVFISPRALPKGEGLMLDWSSTKNGACLPVTSGRILSSDYGAWGSGKKLFSPSVATDGNGLYVLVFQVTDKYNQFGVTTTRDFIHWRPQDYPYMIGTEQCLEPVARFCNGKFSITFHDKSGQYYTTTSQDLIHFSSPVKVRIGQSPSKIRLPYTMVEAIRNHQRAVSLEESWEGELAKDDAERFRDLKEVKAEVHIDGSHSKSISDRLMGIFFEDINYSADGGLNAQLIQNGDFEYEPHDRGGDRNWNQLTAWQKKGDLSLITDAQGISTNNCNAITMSVSRTQIGASMQNSGWDGIYVKKDDKYHLSFYIQGGSVDVSLIDGDKVLAKKRLSGGKGKWKHVKSVLIPKETATHAVLDIRPTKAGDYTIDMVSLMPEDTYKGHGLRRDLAEALEALKPTFMRFPGGCVTHGNGLNNLYHWKETIGPLEHRKPLRNLWGYHQSRQIGFFEFFQMCEDMRMEPLPVLAAGVPCQNSSDGGSGQQGGIPMSEMPAYVQEILDLIEWANGDATTEWGRKRIEQGHKEPFGLKYLGIGNEDLISPTFEERYLMICKAVKAKYPEIQLCGTTGPFYTGSDYETGWRIATDNKNVIDLVDEHYYVSPGWYIYNQHFYDQYDRTAPKVYLGEWASHIPGRKSTIETALSEAIHFCSLERNGDVVAMSSYAPLLAKEGHTQWNPDMIYFTNTEVHPTVGYYVQKMCGNSQGDEYLPSTISVNSRQHGVEERVAVSTVRDSKLGKTYLKLVNMLNREVSTHLTMVNLIEGEKSCRKTVLTGKYDSTTARPEEGEVTLSADCEYVMPAYSFTLIEI